MHNLKVEIVYLATGTAELPTGQIAGTPATAVRITHIPTGTMAQCGHNRSQFKNKQDAMLMLELVLGAKELINA